MSLIRRIELTLLGLFAVLLLGSAVAYFFTVQNSFQQIEQENVQRHIDRVRAVFDYELDQLEFFLSDFSSWDVTYEHMLERNPDYAAQNLEDGTIEYQRIRMVMILSEENDVVYERFLDLMSASASKFRDPGFR